MNKFDLEAFDQEAFDQFVLDNNVIGFFSEPVTLKSGRTSHWYVNWRTVADDVFLLDRLADYVIAFTESQGLNPDCFYGVPEGATKLAVITQYKWAKQSLNFAKGSHCLPMGRGKAKFHGTAEDKYFVGKPKGKVVILEDVTTTGSSLLDVIRYLKKLSDIELIAAIGLTNRMEVTPAVDIDPGSTVYSFKRIFEEVTGKGYDRSMGAAEAIRLAGVEYGAMSSSTSLLPKAYQRLRPEEDIARAIEKEFRDYGLVRKLKLSGCY